MDRIYKVVITGFVIQKDYMDEPDTWDFLDPLQWDDFVDVPDITFTELVEATEVERVIQNATLDSEPFVPVRTIPTDEYSKYLASGRGLNNV